VKRRVQWVVVGLAGLLAAAGADAGLFRAYLSVNGNDANACTVLAPCRLLPAALAAVNSDGEIWLVDSANFNTGPVTITKSVTILAVPGALGSVVGSGGDALIVSGAGIKVALRNLVILNLSAGTNGINFTQGSELSVEDCQVYGLGTNGIAVTASGSAVAVKGSMIRNNAAYGIFAQGALTLTVDGTHVQSNGIGGVGGSGGAKVTVSNSVLANHVATGVSAGVVAGAGGGTTTQVVVERSVLRANSYGAFAVTTASGATVQVNLTRNAITHNLGGYGASAAGGSTIDAVLDGNTITHNSLGISVGGGTASSRQNNTLMFNLTNVSGVLTPLAAQ
jgi:hypothetical protein